MSNNPLPGNARVVIIGGGIGGSSAAYHLAALGVKDVVLLERSMLSSGTTWHSTGNMETYRADPLVFDMVRYAARTYPQLAQDTGREIGWRNVGRVHYTDRADRWEVMRTLPELGKARGIVLELMTPAQVAARLPIIDPEGLAGGVWIPSDARVNATDAVQAFAAAARAKGVKIFQDSMVKSIAVQDGVVRGVETAQGRIDCDIVVLSAGLWSRDLARTCGVRLPMYALEHQYIITKPHGISRELPLFLSYDDQLYGREEVGGLMIGSLDDDAIALPAAALPQNFSFALLNERWPQFEPYMATAMRRFPVMRQAEIKMLLNGPESFTPDGQMLLGPAPGVSGLYTACAFNSNGMALAPAAGRYVAEWIVEGEPSADVAPLDVRRFSPPQAAEGYMRARASEIPGFHCRMHAPDGDYRSARDIRHSPLHAHAAAAGARFVSVNGWERAAWYAPRPDARLVETVAEEVRAALEQVLLVDRSADVKCEATGDTADAGETQSAELQHLGGAHGQIEAWGRSLPWRAGHRLLTASPDQESRVMEWLRRADASELHPWMDLTPGFAMFELHGPERKALQAELLLATDGHDVRIFADRDADSDLLLLPADGAAHLWQQLLSIGARHGLRPGGHLAQEALRIRRGIPGFGAEATPARLAIELGLRTRGAASTAAPRTHAPRRLVALTSPMPYHEFGSREVVMHAGEVVGELTSRVRLPGWPETVALALVDPTRWQPGAALETVAGGKSWPLLPRETAWNQIRAADAAGR